MRFLAALTEHEYEAADRETPRWADAENKRLDQRNEWVLPSLLFDEAEVRAATPDWLAGYGV